MTATKGALGRVWNGLRRSAAVWAVVLCAGCPSMGKAPDWPTVTREIELGAADLRDVALVVADEPTAAALRELAGVLELAAGELGEGGGPAGTLDTLERAVALADELIVMLPEGAQDEARVALVVVRAAMRRARAYVPAGVEG